MGGAAPAKAAASWRGVARTLPLAPPGLACIVTVLSVVAACILDSACLLPHLLPAPPPSLLGPADLAGTSDRCLSSAEVRVNYHRRLRQWAVRATGYQENATQMAEDLSVAEPTKCKLAEASVREREAARIWARHQGAAALHWALVARDVWVYGSLDPFRFDAMREQRRKKLEAKGAKVADGEICEALVSSSTRSNPEWDKAAAGRAVVGDAYPLETLRLYTVPGSALVVTVYMLERLVGRARRLRSAAVRHGNADKKCQE